MSQTNSKQTLLFIEDEKAVLLRYKERLEQEGYRVLEAYDGDEGLKIALEEHPDLILLDILLPKVDGMQVLRKLRKDLWGKHVPVIMITNFNRQQWITESVQLGVYEYLVKSQWSMDDVVLKVKMQLAGR